MRSSQRRRGAGLLAMLGLLGGLVLVGVAPVSAADPVVLRAGTTQDLDSTNPFNTILVVGYEAFQLTYNLLVEFDKDAHPAAGYADSWERAPDKVTFHIRTGMKWSDGTAATSQDVCYSWGLAMAAIKDDTNVGAGYLDPNVKDAGVTKIECPDDSTFVASTTDQSDRIFQVYIPILPKHIYGKDDYKKIADEKFDAPLVGTGPYTLAEWKTGQFARFVRNPNYWGKQGFEDEVVLQIYKNSDTMVQALKSGELDYAHGVNSDQFKQLQVDPTFTTVAGKLNGWSQLAFNEYTKPIKDGGASTKALQDPAFRDALGYATDKQALVDRVLGGFGDPGDTAIPPVLADWHVAPDNPRHFNIDLAKQKLDAAGYTLDSNGKRLDKEGKPINLRLDYPNTDDNYPKVAQFVTSWYAQLGIGVTSQGFDSATLGEIILPPEGDGKAKYDIELWGWVGNPDPNALLQIFRCDAIGSSSDSQYCNPAFDNLYDQQLKEAGTARHDTLAKMQNLIYNDAPYDILYYEASLDVWRNDRFASWQSMPSDGTPLFTYGILDYTLLTDATAVPTPGATVLATGGASGAPTSAPSTGGTSGSSGSTGLLIVLVIVVIVAIAGWLYWRRRNAPKVELE
ncbi:MAG: ABC transporter substrate-binding protein [Chloroflexi bacterium]|nr:MAG: ABC transporter substrate-binding protein [Chloroflexota bacterium]